MEKHFLHSTRLKITIFRAMKLEILKSEFSDPTRLETLIRYDLLIDGYATCHTVARKYYDKESALSDEIHIQMLFRELEKMAVNQQDYLKSILHPPSYRTKFNPSEIYKTDCICSFDLMENWIESLLEKQKLQTIDQMFI